MLPLFYLITVLYTIRGRYSTVINLTFRVFWVAIKISIKKIVGRERFGTCNIRRVVREARWCSWG